MHIFARFSGVQNRMVGVDIVTRPRVFGPFLAHFWAKKMVLRVIIRKNMSEIGLRHRRASLQNPPTPMTRSAMPARLYRVARIPPKGFSLCPCLPQSRIGCTAYHILAVAIMVQTSDKPRSVPLQAHKVYKYAETYGIWTIPTRSHRDRVGDRVGPAPETIFWQKKAKKCRKRVGKGQGSPFVRA